MNGRERYNGQVKPCRSLAELSAVVSGSVRLEILKSLVTASRGVTQLADELELEISHVSHNLSVLKANGLVDVQRIRRSRVYYLTKRVRGSPNGQFINLEISLPTGESALFRLLRNDVVIHKESWQF
ncbi:MAG: winged helix-turn-helix transcriptional regulator [Planctomycetes bacterium]|nr:winged helix-turn-helix transcriptional regulator [Planctomycetota bacterium]